MPVSTPIGIPTPVTPPQPTDQERQSWIMTMLMMNSDGDATGSTNHPNTTNHSAPASPYDSTTIASTPTASVAGSEDMDVRHGGDDDDEDDDGNNDCTQGNDVSLQNSPDKSDDVKRERKTSIRLDDEFAKSSSSTPSSSKADDGRHAHSHRQCQRSSTEITLLGEIIGARDLRLNDEDQLLGGPDDVSTFRPYAVITYGGKRVHKTDKCNKAGPNPIWSPSTKSFFLLKTTAKDMSRMTINISVYSKKNDNLSLPVSLMKSSSIFLGQVNLDAATILDHCDEERIEYVLQDEVGEAASNLGRLAVRFRVATPSDVDVVSFFNKRTQQQQLSVDTASIAAFDEPSHREFNQSTTATNSKTTNAVVAAGPFQRNSVRPWESLITETSEAEIAQSGFVNALSSVFSRNIMTDKTGAKKFRVKPGPDPDRQKDTEFLTSHDLKIETRLPSKKWIDAGSGTLGKLYVEVLSCHGLPNVDLGEAVGDVTDPFCAVVYEDCCCMTDVIDDELSPHWLPWTKRAFAFNMMHPASTLYLGVFDYDLGMGDHDAIGRVAVNVCNLQRDTVHTLKYNLHPSSNVTARTANGSIVIRLRIEWFDERKALLTALKPRPKMHINVTKPKSFRVIRYTCFGEYDNEEKFDLTVARSYINEIFEYKSSLGYLVGDTVRSLMFWRGQVEIISVKLPVHSLLFFLMATWLVERPSLIVPFTFLGLGWALLAMLTVRRQSPSPWSRCPSFLECHEILLKGRSSSPLKNIKENEGAEAARKAEQDWQNRIDNDLMIAEKKAELNQIINEIGDDNIHTKVSQGVIPMDLLLRLARYQGIIRRLCDKLRFIRIIFTWEESVVTFWLTTAFLAVGLVALLLPWGFILTWLGRFIVWGLFGPHMKLVDLTIRARAKSVDSLDTIMKGFDIQKTIARERRERALKVKDIKEAVFGKYSVQIPSFNLPRHFDRPLPDSSGRVCRKDEIKTCGRSSRRLSFVDFRKEEPWIPGQQLYGDLLPRPEYDLSIYEQEVAIQEQALRKFRARVLKIKDADNDSIAARKVLAQLGHDEGSPMAFGYEVALQDDVSSSDGCDGPYDEQEEEQEEDRHDKSRERTHKFKSLALGARVTVRLTSDKKSFVQKRDLNQVVLTIDGDSTYCVSEDSPDEAGLEVIGMGRFSTDASFDQGDLFESHRRSNDSLHLDDTCISSKCGRSENVQVVLFNPDGCQAGDYGKEKEE